MSIDKYTTIRNQISEEDNPIAIIRTASQMPIHFKNDIENAYSKIKQEHPVVEFLMRIPPFRYMFWDKDTRNIIYK
ncbi:MAG: hypothetical protein ACP5NV_00185 [Candidatus Woesearchaeota archaeon]